MKFQDDSSMPPPPPPPPPPPHTHTDKPKPICPPTFFKVGGIKIMKSLDPLRAKKIFIRKKYGHTAVSAIKASSVTLLIWQKKPGEITVNLEFLT